MNWFRFYHAALDDPKVQRLPADVFRGWVNLLCLASEGSERGVLPALDDIAFRLRLGPDEAKTLVRVLIERGLIDDDAGRLSMHNWTGRQRVSDDVNARVRKHRSGPTNSGTSQLNAHVTLHETTTKRSGNGRDTDTERESERETAAAASTPRAPAREQPPPPPNTTTYAETLNGALPKLESLFQELDKDLFTPGWLNGVLVDAERAIGPLSRDQLGRGLNVALKQMRNKMAGTPPTSPRPYARKLIVDYLTEQRDDHHAA